MGKPILFIDGDVSVDSASSKESLKPQSNERLDGGMLIDQDIGGQVE